jgi:hypothetical protein
MVNLEPTAFAPGVTFAGENAQLRFLGSPAQESAIGLLKAPDSGFAMTTMLPDAPGNSVIDDGALRENVAGFETDPVQLGL